MKKFWKKKRAAGPEKNPARDPVSEKTPGIDAIDHRTLDALRARETELHTTQSSEPKALRASIGWITIVPDFLRSITSLLRDHKGKMSSRRMGAGALVTAGIALVIKGTDLDSGIHIFSGFILCALGIVLFIFTRLDLDQS
jgi:hypothetical protein